jgi:hypothetical protein
MLMSIRTSAQEEEATTRNMLCCDAIKIKAHIYPNIQDTAHLMWACQVVLPRRGDECHGAAAASCWRVLAPNHCANTKAKQPATMSAQPPRIHHCYNHA